LTSTSAVLFAGSTDFTVPRSFIVSPGRFGVPSRIATLVMRASGPAQSVTKRPTRPFVVRMFMNTSSTPERCAAPLSWCTGVKSREASAVLTIRLVVSGMSSPGSSVPTFTCSKRTLCISGPSGTSAACSPARSPRSSTRRHVDVDLVERAVDDVRDDPRPLLEVDHRDRERQLVAGDRRVVQHHPAVHRALAARQDARPLRRVARVAHRARRDGADAALLALLDQEMAPVDALPPPAVVERARRADPAGLLRAAPSRQRASAAARA
jgi:hypothetical protein